MPANPGLYTCLCGINVGVWLVAGASKCSMCGWTWGMYEAARLADERRRTHGGEQKESGDKK